MNNRATLQKALEDSLSTGDYTDMFLEDVQKLWLLDGISPEVILREVRVLEGVESSLMDFDGDAPIPLWIGKRELAYNRSPSATKEATQFKGRDSPLNGLWHKHYFINNKDFLTRNVDQQVKKYGHLPLAVMMMRLAEGKVTGEWIVFRKVNEVRTYLCLAKHTTTPTEDLALYERISRALD